MVVVRDTVSGGGGSGAAQLATIPAVQIIAAPVRSRKWDFADVIAVSKMELANCQRYKTRLEALGSARKHGLSHDFFRSDRRGVLSMPLEILHRAFVFFCGGSGIEGAEIATLPSFRIFPP